MKRIFLIGYMGSGKTTIGRRIASKYGLDFVDLDHYIENRYRKSISQLFQENGEDEFRKIEHMLLKEVAEFENTVISTGGGAPCFFDNMEIMNSKGDTVYLKADVRDLFDYLKTKNASKNRPLLAQKSEEELFLFVTESLQYREAFYSQAKYTIDPKDTSDRLFDQLLNQ